MDDAGRTRKAVDAALAPIQASLGGWGVEQASWRPDQQGAPVIWLRTRTRIEAVALQSQVWLLPQLQITMTRLGVPHDLVWRLRFEFTSAEAEAEAEAQAEAEREAEGEAGQQE